MALPITAWGSFSRSAGIYSALSKQAKLLNYGAAKRVTVSFDPFSSEKEPVFYTRQALVYMNVLNRRATNPKCVVKTEVKCDGTPPALLVELLDGSEVLLKAQNLNTLEILTAFNKLVSEKAPQKVEASGPAIQTKAEKAAAAGKSRRGR